MMKLIKKTAGLMSVAIAGKFRELLAKLLSIPRALAKKLADIIKEPFKAVFGKPSSIKDYVSLSGVYVSKRLISIVAVPLAFSAFFVWRYALPYLEGKLWIPTIVINTTKFHTYQGNARVVSREGGLIYAGALNGGEIGGEISGYGTLYDKETLVYEGEFSKNDFDGAGKLYYADGTLKFDGVFESGDFEEGTLYYENGETEFSGMFEANLYKEGALYRENGRLAYEGEFLDGLYDGLGKEYENGRLLYEGEFADGFYSGTGKLYAEGTDRLLYEGEFSGGRYDGQGKLYNGYRERYVGAFTDGFYNGTGILYDTQGRKVYTGQFFMGEIDYAPFIDAEAQLVREAFGMERRLNMFEGSYTLYYDGMDVLFEFGFADEETAPKVQKIKLLGGQQTYGANNGMSVAEFKTLFGGEIFTEYRFIINPEEAEALLLAGSALNEGGECYCVKYNIDTVYIRAFSESETGSVIYYEIGGV